MELLEDIPTLLDIIMILRCLNLRNGSNDEWFKLNQLQSNNEDENLWDSDLEEAAKHTIEIMLEHFSYLDIDRDLLHRLYGILTINAFEIPNAGEANLASVYATGCLPEHNWSSH